MPEDSLAVAANGPRFVSIDDFVFEDILRKLKKDHGIVLPRDYWTNKDDISFGTFIDDLVDISKGGKDSSMRPR